VKTPVEVVAPPFRPPPDARPALSGRPPKAFARPITEVCNTKEANVGSSSSTAVITGLDPVIHATSAWTEAALGTWTARSSLIKSGHHSFWLGMHLRSLLERDGAGRSLGWGQGLTERSVDARRIKRIGLPAVFGAFFRLGITSFGGGTAGWLYREIVERRHWIDDREFLSSAALGRLVPGSGGVNLTVQVGQRLRGGSGAVAAVLGLLSGPLLIVLALAAGYTWINQSSAVHAVFDGVAAAAIGLTFATGLKLVHFRAAAGPLAVTFATVLSVGVLRWPMVPVVLCLAPISIGLALLTGRGRNA
jgi:chromate transporter